MYASFVQYQNSWHHPPNTGRLDGEEVFASVFLFKISDLVCAKCSVALVGYCRCARVGATWSTVAVRIILHAEGGDSRLNLLI